MYYHWGFTTIYRPLSYPFGSEEDILNYVSANFAKYIIRSLLYMQLYLSNVNFKYVLYCSKLKKKNIFIINDEKIVIQEVYCIG